MFTVYRNPDSPIAILLIPFCYGLAIENIGQKSGRWINDDQLTMTTPASGRCHGLAKEVGMCHGAEAQLHKIERKLGKDKGRMNFYVLS